MIHINLLPIRKVKRAEASQRQFVYMGMAILATVVGVVFLHLQADGELETIKVYANSHYVTPKPTLQQAIKSIKSELKQRLEELSHKSLLSEEDEAEEKKIKLHKAGAAKAGPTKEKETPSSSGRRNFVKLRRLASNSKLCSSVLPKPMPTSSTTCSGAMPACSSASQATSSRSRCWGSRLWASRGEIPKNAASKSSTP